MKKTAIFISISLIIATLCFLLTIIYQIDATSWFDFPTIKRSSIDAMDSPYFVNRTGKHCRASFDWGEMCPKLYTELGGKCDLINDTLQCPDIRRNFTKFVTRQAQLVLIRMLRIFDLLAQKHKIDYWITRGTLLGAARHHGFIPWDLDADIEIPLKDYVKFFQVVAKELPDDIFFQNCKSDPPLMPDDPSEYKEHKIVGIYQAIKNPRLRDRNSCYRYCLAYGCKWHDGLMVDIFVVPNVGRSVYPLKRLPFEGFTLPVQNDWRKELVSQFGDKWFEFPTDKSPDEHPDVYNGCDKLKN